MSKISTSEGAVLLLVKAVGAAGIGCRVGGDLHRPLRRIRLGPPHSRIGAVARLGSVYGEGDAIDHGASARDQQIHAAARGCGGRSIGDRHHHRPKKKG